MSLLSWMWLAACGGPAELAQPNPPPEWPLRNLSVPIEPAEPVAPAPEAPPPPPPPPPEPTEIPAPTAPTEGE